MPFFQMQFPLIVIKLFGRFALFSRYPCEIRVRSVPLQPCRRHGKKRKEEDVDSFMTKKTFVNPRQSPGNDSRLSRPPSVASDSVHGYDSIDSQLQSSQVCICYGECEL